MSVYEFRVRPEASWGTPWHADTLWGSLCWAWLEAGGTKELEKLLELFAAGQPPFVISDAFPSGLLPVPFGANTPHKPGEKIKAIWCTTQDFQRWCSGSLPKLPVSPDEQRPFSTRSILHVRVSRNTGTADDGGLFEEDEHFFNGAVRSLSIYVRIQDAAATSALSTCFEMLGRKGYGRKASTGLGVFSLEGPQVECPWLDIGPAHSGFVSLSHFVPARTDPTTGSWRLLAKNPKFAAERVLHFLKGNLVTLAPGSTFQTSESPRPFYGKMLKMNREGLENALHYGLAFVAPINYPCHS